MAQLELRNISLSFKSGKAVEAVDLSVAAGETVAVFGPSGAGKTVLLRLVAGIHEPETGSVSIGGRNVTREGPEDRGIGMAFQNFALFPHLSAFDNIATGLTAFGVPRATIKAKVEAVAALLKIGHVLGHKPKELSNGQKQRTALARALVAEPKILLLDDPLRNVDAKLRYEMRLELPNLLRRNQSAVLYVTQDYKEAMALGDRIAVMVKGRIAQIDTPEAVYVSPASVDIARLFGDPTINLVPVVPALSELGLAVSIGNARVDLGPGFRAAAGRSCILGLRPESLVLSEEASEGAVPVDVVAATPLNERVVLLVKTLDGQEILASSAEPPLGGRHEGRAFLRFDPQAALLFDGESGVRIDRTAPAAKPEPVHAPAESV